MQPICHLPPLFLVNMPQDAVLHNGHRFLPPLWGRLPKHQLKFLLQNGRQSTNELLLWAGGWMCVWAFGVSQKLLPWLLPMEKTAEPSFCAKPPLPWKQRIRECV